MPVNRVITRPIYANEMRWPEILDDTTMQELIDLAESAGARLTIEAKAEGEDRQCGVIYGPHGKFRIEPNMHLVVDAKGEYFVLSHEEFELKYDFE